MLIVWFFVYKKLAQFAVRGALPPRRLESPGCAADNKPSCVLHLLGSFIGSRGFSSLEQRPEFWVLQCVFKKIEIIEKGYFFLGEENEKLSEQKIAKYVLLYLTG